jgi:hypothetical protein
MIVHVYYLIITVIMTTRRPCVNVATASYSGKEQSPLHFGLSAEGYENGTIMEGHDHMMWVVKSKNNRKVWVRQMCSGKMVHEEPVINDSIEELKKTDDSNEAIHIIVQPTEKEPSSEPIQQPPEQQQPPIMKANVEEKKINDYNIFLTYRLQELKKSQKSSNKEIFNSVVAEWKELKKNTANLNKVIVEIKSKQLT